MGANWIIITSLVRIGGSMTLPRWRWILPLAAWLCSCGASTSQLRSRAAFDLQCDEARLQIVEIDSATRGVVGCGQRATYIEVCRAKGTSCTWVLNADLRPATAMPRRSAPVVTASSRGGATGGRAKKLLGSQAAGTARLELQEIEATHEIVLRYSAMGAKRTLKDCQELVLLIGDARHVLPARYGARAMEQLVLEALEAVVPDPVSSALAGAQAASLQICGTEVTVEPQLWKGLSKPASTGI